MNLAQTMQLNRSLEIKTKGVAPMTNIWKYFLLMTIFSTLVVLVNGLIHSESHSSDPVIDRRPAVVCGAGAQIPACEDDGYE